MINKITLTALEKKSWKSFSISKFSKFLKLKPTLFKAKLFNKSFSLLWLDNAFKTYKSIWWKYSFDLKTETFLKGHLCFVWHSFQAHHNDNTNLHLFDDLLKDVQELGRNFWKNFRPDDHQKKSFCCHSFIPLFFTKHW